MQGAPARVRADAEAVERFREVSEPLIAAIGKALDDATEYGNARRGYATCAPTDVLHARFHLALARFKAGELTTPTRWRTFSEGAGARQNTDLRARGPLVRNALEAGEGADRASNETDLAWPGSVNDVERASVSRFARPAR
jgi:hypothetical protein